jgi:predicted O-linked N-acetylglucosamine transferase (SPINDLY family)
MNHLIPQLGRESMMHLQNGNLLEAEKLLLKILEINPHEINALKLYGFVLTQKNDLSGAINALKKALELTPQDLEIIFNLAKAHFDSREFQQSIAVYEKFISLAGNQIEVLLDMGTANCALDRPKEAIQFFDKVISIDPSNFAAFSNKAGALTKLKHYEAALENIEKAIHINPRDAISWNNKCDILIKIQHFADALVAAKKSIELNPNLIEAYVNLGNTLTSLKQFDDAIKIYQEVVKLEPNNVQNWIHLGGVLADAKHYAEALDAYDHASILQSDYKYLQGNRLHLLALMCKWDATYIDLAQAAQKHQTAYFSSPFPLLSRVDDPALILEASAKYANDYCPINTSLGPIKKYENGKIRLGYFSADFRNHPVAFLSAELYELHHRDEFEVYGFYFGPTCSDEMHQRLSKAFDRFVDIRHLSDIEIAKLAREYQIDIAIDLGGYTQDTRPGIFAYRAAPIQVSYLGYLGTMGSQYMDYLISDYVITPLGSDLYYSESLVRLPSYQVNDRKRTISGAQFLKGKLGIPEEHFVFCCLNNNYKFTPKIFSSWVNILRKVEGSTLLIFAENDIAASNLLSFANKKGLDTQRIVFAEKLPYSVHLARYQMADLFLDSFPYNAGTTASDALWVGLPVLTLQGKSFASRVASSLLTAIDLTELITHSLDEYATKAIQLALNNDMLLEIKDKLARNKGDCQLFNTPLFTENIEKAYQSMYAIYNSGQPPQAISV